MPIEKIEGHCKYAHKENFRIPGIPIFHLHNSKCYLPHTSTIMFSSQIKNKGSNQTLTETSKPMKCNKPIPFMLPQVFLTVKQKQ